MGVKKQKTNLCQVFLHWLYILSRPVCVQCLAILQAWLQLSWGNEGTFHDGLLVANFKVSQQPEAFITTPMDKVKQTHPLGKAPATFELQKPVRGHWSPTPDATMGFDKTLFYVSLYLTRQTYKDCRKKGRIICSNFVCSVCKIHLCFIGIRNCFVEYHNAVA